MFGLLVSIYCLFIWRLGEKTSHREDFTLRKLIFFPPSVTYWFFPGAFMDTNLQFTENLHVFLVSAFFFYSNKFF